MERPVGETLRALDARPLVAKRDGAWRIIYYFDTSPVEYATLPDAYNQAARYA